MRRNAGDRRDHDLMRDHQYKAARLDLRHPLAKRGKRHFAIDMAVEEGIQAIMRHEGTDIHFLCGVPASAPAAAEDDIRGDPVGLHIGADGPRLRAPDIVEIALRGAVIDVEIRRVAKAGGQRVSQEQNVAIDFGDGLAKRFGAGLLREQQRGCQKCQSGQSDKTSCV